MKIGMQRLRFFILLFAVCLLLVHSPSDFEAFAATGDVSSIAKISSSTDNGPVLANTDYFGITVANIGDLDGDGVNDLAVGAQYDNMDENGNASGGTKRGAVHIIFMKTDGTPKSTAEINDSTANGPDLADLDLFGTAVANIGDLDGDGVNDLAVTARGDDTDENGNASGGTARGAVYIIFMNTNGTPKSTEKIDDSTANGPDLANNDFWGYAVENIGDLDGDGVNDLAVGTSNDSTGGAGRGAVHIMFMNTNGTPKSTEKIDDTTANGPDLANGDAFGGGIANIGDLDGDGVNDLAVGAKNDDLNHDPDDVNAWNEGAVYIIFMNTNGTPKSTEKIDDSTTGGPVLARYDDFGRSVENIGDLDGDGVNDLAVGAILDDTDENGDMDDDHGAVHIIFMKTDGTPKSTVVINDSTASGPDLANDDLFGYDVANIGDLDGDGVNDLAVTAMGDDTGGSNRGAVYIIFMGDTIPSKVGTVTPTCGNTQSALSWSAPATGGAAITDYIIQYSTDNSTWSTFSDGTSTSTSATVTGLTNGTLYYFKVAAVNSVGTGTYSSAVSCTPATTPSQVTSCTSKAFTNEAQLSWTAPATGGAAITDYIPQYSTDDSTWSTFSDGTSTSTTVTVTGLTNGVLYYFKVAAVNSVGTGPYCSSTSVTVDEYSTDFQWFPAGGSIGAGTTGECADFTAGAQTFGRGVIFGLKNGIPDGQVWEHDDVTFSQFMKFTGANDFTAVTQTFETGTSFGIDTTFNDGQTLPQYTITSSGVLLEEITCGTDTSSNTCIPNDVTKYLSPGEFLTTGIDTTETYSCISSDDKSFTIDGMGVTMSFDTIATSGDVKLDYYDPENVPAATANADGSVSISLASATVETVGSIIDLSLETAAVTGDITITLPYLDASIPSGSTESDLVVLHYVDNAWKTEDNCTIDTTNNKITCTVSSLSPFGIGISTPNTSATSVSSSSSSSTCSMHIILGNCGTISINNDEYQIIDTWTNVPTTEVLVGQPVTVTLSIPNNPTHTKIHFASVYTGIFDSPTNYEQGAHIGYSIMSDKYSVSKAELFQVAGATHRITQDPDVKNLDMFEVVFTMIFAKPMDTSHIVVETENKFGIPETLYLTSALKVDENLQQALTLEEKSKFSIVNPEPQLIKEPEPYSRAIMDPEPVLSFVCGEGTILIEGVCEVQEMQMSFLDWLFSLFS